MLNRETERPEVTLTLVALCGGHGEQPQEVASVHNFFSPCSVTVMTWYEDASRSPFLQTASNLS